VRGVILYEISLVVDAQVLFISTVISISAHREPCTRTMDIEVVIRFKSEAMIPVLRSMHQKFDAHLATRSFKFETYIKTQKIRVSFITRCS